MFCFLFFSVLSAQLESGRSERGTTSSKPDCRYISHSEHIHACPQAEEQPFEGVLQSLMSRSNDYRWQQSLNVAELVVGCKEKGYWDYVTSQDDRHYNTFPFLRE